MILPRGSILAVNNGTLSGTLTEHNRQAISLSPSRIGNTERMWNGDMRASFVANKYSFTATWNDLPSADSLTADGFHGGKWIKDFYDTTTGTVTCTLQYDGTITTHTMLMTSFSYEVTKRTTNAINSDLVSISITFEEI